MFTHTVLCSYLRGEAFKEPWKQAQHLIDSSPGAMGRFVGVL